MYDCIIIGGGIFGSIVAKKLRRNGMFVAAVDNEEPLAGSRPAACLMKPSWYSSMGPKAFEPALEQLNELYDVRKIQFETKIAKVSLDWIDPQTILIPADFCFRVGKIERSDNGWNVYKDVGTNYPEAPLVARNVILAAGVWCNKILHNSNLSLVPELSAQTGTSFCVGGQTIPKISVWMPYKQLVSFNIRPETIWVGDGVAAKEYTSEHLRKSRERCATFLGKHLSELASYTGHRPYVKNAKPCYLEQHAPDLWVITGGAKNGTIAAGWVAHKLGEILS